MTIHEKLVVAIISGIVVGTAYVIIKTAIMVTVLEMILGH